MDSYVENMVFLSKVSGLHMVWKAFEPASFSLSASTDQKGTSWKYSHITKRKPENAVRSVWETGVFESLCEWMHHCVLFLEVTQKQCEVTAMTHRPLIINGSPSAHSAINCHPDNINNNNNNSRVTSTAINLNIPSLELTCTGFYQNYAPSLSTFSN